MKVFALRSMSAVALAAALLWTPVGAQDRLKAMPGYDQYRRCLARFRARSSSARSRPSGMTTGRHSSTRATASGIATTSRRSRRRSLGDAAAGGAGGFGGRGRGGQSGNAPARGRQFDSAESPDKKLKAFYKDRNLWLSAVDGSNPVAITTDGSEKDRIKYGTASWVYGEELAQRTAMWWSPDSRSSPTTGSTRSRSPTSSCR